MVEEYSHKDAIAALTDAELTALKQTSDAPGLWRLLLHSLALLGLGIVAMRAPAWWLYLPVMLLLGIAISFLFTLEHEAIHGTAFQSPWINACVAEVAGFLLLLPPRHFRYFHLAHHRFTQDLSRDPELSSPRPRGWRAYFLYLSGLRYWQYAIAGLVSAAYGRVPGPYVPANGRRKVVLEARCHVAALAALVALSVFFGWTWPLWLWVISSLLGQPFLRAFLLAEHAGCPMVADMLSNSRTTFSSRFVQLLAWNMPHHSAHHALPVVPFHQLPALTKKLEARLKATAQGYRQAHRQIRASWSKT